VILFLIESERPNSLSTEIAASTKRAVKRQKIVAPIGVRSVRVFLVLSAAL
jgi:hypothetical protein